jgi:SAM-dependent methyltransferase
VSQAPSIEDVRTFWQGSPCGEDTAADPGTLRHYIEVEAYRYAHSPHIPEVAEFERFAGKRVLEIGCGIGTDGVQFARAGAEYVGVDLTNAAVERAAENFALRGLRGRFEVADAESLPLEPDSFDHVYSFGVIHHSPTPSAILAEILRVLRPGGTVTVMLYNRTSINYYVEIMFLRKLGRTALRPEAAPAVMARVLGLPREKLEGHRRNMLRVHHPTPEQWISMNTDGPDCPLARVYSAKDAKSLFSQFVEVETEVRLFDRSHWPLVGRLVSDRMARTIGSHAGWHRIVHARKPLD